MITQDLCIDQDLLNLLPLHTKEELEQLEKNIVEEGRVRNPLIYWHNDGKNTIVDGMHRYEIAERLGLPYRTEPKIFENREEVEKWIIDNALGQRNIQNPLELRLARGHLMMAGIEAAKKSKNSRGAKNSTNVSVAATTKEVAEKTGVDEGTLYKNKQLAEAMDSLDKKVQEDIRTQKVKASDADIKRLAKLDKDKQKQAVEAVKTGSHAKIKDAIAEQGPSPWDNIAPGLKTAVKEHAVGDAEVERLAEFNMDQQREIMKTVPGEHNTIAQAIGAYENGPEGGGGRTERQKTAAEYKLHLDGMKKVYDKHLKTIDNIRDFLQETGAPNQIEMGDEFVRLLSEARSVAAKLARTMN